MELSRRTIQRMILRESGDTTVINQGGEGGGGGVTLGPLLASLNAVAMPTAEGYLHWNGSAWEFPSIDLSSYATQQWVLQQGYITSSAISDMATETWVLQQGYITSSAISDMATKTWVGQNCIVLTQGKLTDNITFSGADDVVNGLVFYYGNTNIGKFGVTKNGNNYYLSWTPNSGTAKKVLFEGDAPSFPFYASTADGTTVDMNNTNGLSMKVRSASSGVYALDYLPMSGGTVSGSVTLSTNGDRKLVLNNTDNELWNIISFQDNGTEVGYLGLCGSNALAWNQHEILLAGYDNDFITHGNEFTFASAGYGSDVSLFPNGRMVWFNYRTASGNLDGNISSYKFGDGKGGELAEISGNGFKITGGTSAQFLKADGSVDSTSYLPLTGGSISGLLTFTAGFTVNNRSYNIDVKQSLDVSGSFPVYNIQFLDNGTATANVCTFAFNGDVKTTRGLNGASLRLDYKDSTYPTNDFYLKQTIAPNGYIRQCTFAPFLSSDDSDISPTFGYKFEGTVVADNISNNSDIRLKDIIRDEAFDAESIAKMPLVTYSWKKDEEKRAHFGTIAQNWEKVIPEVVSEAPDGMKAMDYGAAAMAAGVTACREVVALKKEIAKLEEIINQLKQ